MSVIIRVKNNCSVNAYRDGKLTAKAYRANTSEKWFIGIVVRKLNEDNQLTELTFVVGTIGPPLLEVNQRKAIQALLKAIG